MNRLNVTRSARWLVALILMSLCFVKPGVAGEADRKILDRMTGCWISDNYDPTSLLKDASNAESAEIVTEKMLLIFHRIDGTDYLVFGHIFEWDKADTYVLGPTYQNGAYNPAAGFLTFGYPEGSLDHVTQSDPDKLLYFHAKSSKKSAMSVRRLSRIDCAAADQLESDLFKRQKRLN